MPLFIIPGLITSTSGGATLNLNSQSTMQAVKYLLGAWGKRAPSAANVTPGLADRVLANITDRTWGPDDSTLFNQFAGSHSEYVNTYKGTSQPTAAGLCSLFYNAMGLAAMATVPPDAATDGVLKGVLFPWFDGNGNQCSVGSVGPAAVVVPTDNIGTTIYTNLTSTIVSAANCAAQNLAYDPSSGKCMAPAQKTAADVAKCTMQQGTWNTQSGKCDFTDASALATAKQACKSSSGTWDDSTNTCITSDTQGLASAQAAAKAQAAKAQADCTATGGTWDPTTSICTPKGQETGGTTTKSYKGYYIAGGVVLAAAGAVYLATRKRPQPQRAGAR